MSVLTVGIDLASADKKTAACWIQWQQGEAVVTNLQRGATDDALIDAIERAEKIGIDVPFGWPDGFVSAIAAYSDTGRWPATAPQPSKSPKRLQFRATDRFVHARTGHWPLSVSSDRIAVPAMRAAVLFTRLAAGGQPVARDGSGKVVEVYPAAAIRRWWGNAYAQGYKDKKGRDQRCALVEKMIEGTAGWLRLSTDIGRRCQDDDDALDALIAALIARAATVASQCEPIPNEARAPALREGWIALPKPEALGGLV